MHRPSDTFDTCWLWNWHRHWLVVWSRPGSTTAMLCSTALPATASRSCSEYRTTQLGSFSRLQDDPITPARCWGRYTAWLQILRTAVVIDLFAFRPTLKTALCVRYIKFHAIGYIFNLIFRRLRIYIHLLLFSYLFNNLQLKHYKRILNRLQKHS